MLEICEEGRNLMLSFKLFPTNVYVREDCKIDNKKLSEIIFKKEKTEPSSNISNVGGWQSKTNLYKDERFSEILKEVALCFQETIYEQINYKTGDTLIHGMWGNVNRYKDYNLTHSHGEAEWSFVYYVKVPKNSGNLVLVDPRVRRPESTTKGLIENHKNSFTHDIFLATPKEGHLILFPAWLEHYVECNESKQPRISIAGNVEMRNEI